MLGLMVVLIELSRPSAASAAFLCLWCVPRPHLRYTVLRPGSTRTEVRRTILWCCYCTTGLSTCPPSPHALRAAVCSAM